MKNLLYASGILCSFLWSAKAQEPAVAPTAEYDQTSEFGPHHRAWTSLNVQTNALGVVTVHTNRYIQLETGLHYAVAGQWFTSEPRIAVLPDGTGLAAKGQHQVRIWPNAADPVMAEVRLPEGQVISTRIMGLVYHEVTTGQEVLIAEVKDSIGQLLPNEREVLYPGAFTDMDADILLSYSKAAFEQQILFREQPPHPQLWGLDAKNVQIQVWTEVLESPVPLEKQVQAAAAQTNALANAVSVDEEVLTFGTMSITRGKAFNLDSPDDALHVRKHWEQRKDQNQQPRQFLIESVPWPSLLSKIEHLPPAPVPQEARVRQPSLREFAGIPARGVAEGRDEARAKNSAEPMQLARTDLARSRPGASIDYTLINNGAANLTLQAGSTYFVSGYTAISGVTRIEPTVVKYANTNNAQLKIQGTIQCLTGPYWPAWFTAADDNSIGQIIGSVTNQPSGTYAVTALDIDNNNSDLRYLRIAWAQRAINYGSASCYPHFLYHSQILNCNQGIVSASPVFHVRNALFYNVLTNFDASASGITGHCEHLSVNAATRFNNSANLTLKVTNSLLVAVTTTGSYSGSNNQTSTSSNGVWQTVGGGGHYLIAGSGWRGAGSTNISSQLSADIKRKTSYPPIVIGSPISASTTWYPQAGRDIDTTPDLGFLYDPIDYLIADIPITNNAVLLLTNGVAIGTTGGYGFQMYGNSKIISEGTPTNPNRFARYRIVQENPLASLDPYSHTIAAFETVSGIPETDFRHTVMSSITSHNGSYQITASGAVGMAIRLRDCRFQNGGLDPNNGYGSNTVTFDANNCLFERVYN